MIQPSIPYQYCIYAPILPQEPRPVIVLHSR